MSQPMSEEDILPIILQNKFQYKDKTYRVCDIVTSTTRRFNRICTKDIKNMNYIKYIKVLQQIKKLGIENLIQYDKIYAYKEYILLEMYDYPHSLSVIDSTHYFNESNIIDILTSICKGNMSLHERNIVNGNIHPNNILIEGLNIIISDYCKNTLYGTKLTLSASKIAYLSPETIANKKIDIKSDIWSIGCIFYYILTNKHAFEDESIKKTTEKIINNDYLELNCKYSKLYSDLLKKILQIIPSNRITLKDLLNEIEKVDVEIQRQSLHESVASAETTKDKKKILNEYLLQKISKSNPDNSSEIVEMILLQMNILDILKMIDTPSLLEDKIRQTIEELNSRIKEEEYTISSIESPQSSFSSYSSSSFSSPLLLTQSPPLIPLQPVQQQSLSQSLLSNTTTIIEENTDKWRNCYFKNFPKSWLKSDLIDLFSKYGGNVQTIEVKDGFGYVYFHTNEEAKKIIQELNGKTLSFGSKPFYIGKYISKSIRKLSDEQSQLQSIPPLIESVDDEDKKEFSNYLYQSVLQNCPDDNPLEITRMLLEMDVSDILLMINNPVLLKEKILELVEKMNSCQKETQQSQRKLSKRERKREKKRKEEIKKVKNQQQKQVALSQQLIASTKTVEEKKKALSEYLYYNILKECPEKAPQLTGMILEMDVSDILLMIDNPSKLKNKIKENLSKLNKI